MKIADLTLEHLNNACFKCGSFAHRTNKCAQSPTPKGPLLLERWRALKPLAPKPTVGAIKPVAESASKTPAPSATAPTPVRHSLAMLCGYPPNLISSRTRDKRNEPYKLEQSVLINKVKASASIDSQARGGNWIAYSFLLAAKLIPHPCSSMEFESPLFENLSVSSNEGTTIDVTFTEWGLTIEKVLFRIMPDSAFSNNPRIIIGADIINEHRLLD
jgi:hypothetical protein